MLHAHVYNKVYMIVLFLYIKDTVSTNSSSDYICVSGDIVKAS